MARAREVPNLTCADPYALAAARVVEVRADELLEQSAGVLDIADIERVHDMRVASRRLRAALEIFEPCFAGKDFKRALREVKAIADALGERRDRDVAIVSMEKLAAKMAVPDRPGVEFLIERLREEQAAANESLKPLVADPYLASLRQRLGELATAASGPAAEAKEEERAAAPGAVELDGVSPRGPEEARA
jgi:CHAD domain-containing protein